MKRLASSPPAVPLDGPQPRSRVPSNPPPRVIRPSSITARFLRLTRSAAALDGKAFTHTGSPVCVSLATKEHVPFPRR